MNSKTAQPLFIRADAGGDIGTGHVMRMLALAQGWGDRFSVFGDRWEGDKNQESGVRSRESADTSSVVFICARLPEALEQRLQSEGFEVVRIEAEPGSEADVQATLAVVQGTRSREQRAESSEHGEFPSSISHIPYPNKQWLITDGYHFNYAYQKAIKTAGLSLLCVDDHGYSERWCCDAILNQNLDAEKRCRYDNDVPGAKYLLGSDYCLLRREFLKAPVERIPRGRIERLLVTLGGSDPENATGATLRLLNAACERSLTIRVLAGVDNPHLEQLQAFASHHTIEVLTKVTDMPAQYAWADGIISAGGSTCWEWVHAGLPGAIVTIAENQLPIVQALTETRRAALSLGWFQQVAADVQGSSLTTWLEAPGSVTDQDASRSLIDGLGAARVGALFASRLKINMITAAEGWLYSRLQTFKAALEKSGHHVSLVTLPEELGTGDLLFILSYWGLLPQDTLIKNTHNLVVHESALPQGKGWSPVTWQVIEGKSEIPITLFEAFEQVDAGCIYADDLIRLEGHELIDEIRDIQARKTFELCQAFVSRYPEIVATKREQKGEETFYARRRPEDSALDPAKSIAEQFNLLRVVDNDAYPAFFDNEGDRYILKIFKKNGKSPGS